MSVAEAPVAPAPLAASTPVRRVSTRFFRSELLLIFGRRRNWIGMAILAAVPIIIAVAVKVWAPPGGDPGGDFFAQITRSGLFVPLAALMVELPLFLPLAVAAIAGDAIAGEANLGTLRYLLAVPVHRTRLLAVKFGALVVFAIAAVLLIAVVGAVLGLILFGAGPMTLLSGTTVGFWGGVGRLLLVCAYIVACLTALGAIGLFISTLTEQPIGAAIALLILTVVSEIVDAIPQIAVIRPYLPTHYWLGFGDLLRDPIDTTTIGPGLLSALVYTAVFLSASWARFSARDVSS